MLMDDSPVLTSALVSQGGAAFLFNLLPVSPSGFLEMN